MKKILHLTISSQIGGGPEHIFQLISGISGQYEMHVACPTQGPYYHKFEELTLGRVTLLPHRKYTLKSFFSVLQYIKKNKIDLLHGHGKGAGFYCRLLSLCTKVAVIHTPHGINKKIESGLINKFYIKFERFFSYLINAVIFVSKTESDYAKQLNLWDNVPSEIINNGTKVVSDIERSEWRVEKRKQLNCIECKVIITASRFDYQKNTLEFCEIAKKMTDYTFVILGDGEQRKEYEDYCLYSKVNNVVFTGNVLNPLHYFAAADIYLSTARWEGLSMAILESMALGLPVVATEVIGNIDLVNHGETGFLYTIGEIAEAENYLNTILETNFSEFSQKSKDFHKSFFSSDAMCLKTSALYAKVFKN